MGVALFRLLNAFIPECNTRSGVNSHSILSLTHHIEHVVPNKSGIGSQMLDEGARRKYYARKAVF